MHIICNPMWRELVPYDELPDEVAKEFTCLDPAEQFSELDGAEDPSFAEPRFVKYRHRWFDVQEFITTISPPYKGPVICGFDGWDGYLSEMYGFGMLCRLGRANEGREGLVQMGRYWA